MRGKNQNIFTSFSARFLQLFLLTLVLAPAMDGLGAGTRVKDLVMIAGARDNQLVGYGLVVGLAGDGDKNPVYTLQSVANMLQRFGITIPATTLQAKNVAGVIVTADIPAFLKPGSRLDVHVSSMGDAKSLQGGVLLQAPLLGADGKVLCRGPGAFGLGRAIWAVPAAGAERPCRRIIPPSPKSSGALSWKRKFPRPL